MKIVHFPHPSLMTKSSPVTEFNSDLDKIANEMIELMHISSGVGLAANQVALNKRIFVMQCTKEKPPYVFINPETIQTSGTEEKNDEGCLSFPGLNIEVPRQQWVEVQWKNTKGETMQERFTGLESICVQHETDHLNGINFVDKIGNVKKMMSLKKYTSMKKKMKP